MNKVVENVEKALEGIQDGMTLMVGGFGLCGIPENSIAELVKLGTKKITLEWTILGLGFCCKTNKLKK